MTEGGERGTHQQQTVNHVAHKEGLLGLRLLANANVGEQLPLQNLPGVLYARLLGDAWNAPALANVVQSHLQASQATVNRLIQHF